MEQLDVSNSSEGETNFLANVSQANVLYEEFEKLEEKINRDVRNLVGAYPGNEISPIFRFVPWNRNERTKDRALPSGRSERSAPALHNRFDLLGLLTLC